MNLSSFDSPVQQDWEGLRACILRRGTPKRVYFMELFLDAEMQDRICEAFGIIEGLDQDDPYFEPRKQVRLQRFLGYDYVRCRLEGLDLPLKRDNIEDTATLRRSGGRNFMEEHRGPITDWESFDKYPWPDPEKISTQTLEWYEDNLPEDMCIMAGGGLSHFAEYLTWLMGYEHLCFSLYDQRDLVKAMSRRLVELYDAVIHKIFTFNKVKLVMAGDDMGFRSSTLISPDDLKEFVLPGHKHIASLCHQAGRPYMLHSCGNLEAIMPDLIEDVEIDAKHSFEDTIIDVRDAKDLYGNRIAVIGGIDVDFLCRADEEQIRRRVRDTLEHCLPGGGYCLGTGNSVANYIPMENYLIMLDEGRKFTL